MKKNREKEMQGLEAICIVSAGAVCILSVLFLFDAMQNHWFLNSILGLGVLLHAAAALLFVLRHRTVLFVSSIVLALVYSAALIYFNV